MSNSNLNSTVSEILSGMSGLLFHVSPADRKENGPNLTGFLSKQEKREDGSYKTVTRLDVACFPATSKDGKYKYEQCVIAGGLSSFTLFKNETPTGDSPPDATGTVENKESGMRSAGRNAEVKGSKCIKISLYKSNAGAGSAAPKSSQAPSVEPLDEDDIPF